jgi:hypothetical protein
MLSSSDFGDLRQWHGFQPGNPFPGGADININLDVTPVSSIFSTGVLDY